MSWFAEIGDSIVDSGNPFGPGREVTSGETRDLPLGADAASGYTIVNAESMDAAQKLLENCPIITSVRIYEAMPMQRPTWTGLVVTMVDESSRNGPLPLYLVVAMNTYWSYTKWIQY